MGKSKQEGKEGEIDREKAEGRRGKRKKGKEKRQKINFEMFKQS